MFIFTAPSNYTFEKLNFCISVFDIDAASRPTLLYLDTQALL